MDKVQAKHCGSGQHEGGINIPYLEKALYGDQLHAGREPWQPGESMKTQNKTPSKPGATEQVM